MSIERTIIERLNESRRLDEAFPPILNQLMKHEKSRVTTALTRAGIDIENTPYELAVITNGRDPRLQGKNVVIFELANNINKVAVWFDGAFLVDVYVYPAEKNISKMSWKTILSYATRITVMKFDPKQAEILKQKRDERYNIKKSMMSSGNMRYTQKNRPKYVTLDKSGYVVDPKKYQKMLAEMKLGDASKVLQSAKEMYTKLAGNLDKIDWDNDRDYYNYDTIMKLIVRNFQELTQSLSKYEKYKADNPNIDSSDADKWWYESLKKNVTDSIQSMREVMSQAKKYL